MLAAWTSATHVFDLHLCLINHDSSSTTDTIDPKLKEPFINARYNVSLVLYKHALADESQKEDLLGKAFREIGSTRFLVPDMGGPEQFKKFDALLKNIQKAQGKDIVGLTPVSTKQP